MWLLAWVLGGTDPSQALVDAARRQIGKTLRYDSAYARLDYPRGDVPLERGVCTDVVIRALRAQGVDLQQRVHEDMVRAFREYPRAWGVSKPDANIDHRRVLNLQTFFRRQGKAVEGEPRPGDIITVTVPPNLPHVLLVSDRRGPSGNLLVIHNIGRGTQEEDALYEYPHTGHYRWF